MSLTHKLKIYVCTFYNQLVRELHISHEFVHIHHRRLLRGGRLIIMVGMEQME
jgi:hypothetical protein